MPPPQLSRPSLKTVPRFCRYSEGPPGTGGNAAGSRNAGRQGIGGRFGAALSNAGITEDVVKILVDNGIEDAETLALVEPADLKAMGIPMGTGLKLRKAARAL